MDDRTERRILDTTGEAMAAFLARRSVLLTVGAPRKAEQIATGTCLKLGSRFFIATCAHAFRATSLRDIWVCHTREGYQRRVELTNGVLDGGSAHSPVDIAALEVAPEVAEQLDREFVEIGDLGNIATRGTHHLYLFGFPRDLVLREPLRSGEFHYASYCWSSDPLDAESFPPEADLDLDVCFEYTADGEPSGASELVKTPSPVGFSGGGIWALNPNIGDPLVGPQHAKWIGIQRAWCSNKRISYGNKVQVLLNLLGRSYPELKGPLSGTKPEKT